MRSLVATLKVLFSHWRRHPLQLVTLVVGLVCATALWSGVQALNQQARASYDRAAAIFGGARTATIVSRDGATFSQRAFVDLRRAGWAVSPVLEERVQVGGSSLRLIGIEPISMPKEAGSALQVASGTLATFLTPPYQTLVSRETLTDAGLTAGDRPQLKNGNSLPPVVVDPALAPGIMVVDIGVAQRVLDKSDQISRLLVASNPIGPAAPLATVTQDRLRLVPAEAESNLESLTDSFHLNLTAFGFLAFAVGLFIVNAAIGLTFEQRRPVFRTLRACGIPARTLNAALLIELISFALVAGVVGMIAGFAIAAFLLPNVAASLHSLYGAEIPGQLTLRPSWWLAGLAMTLLGTLMAAANGLIGLQRLSILASAQPAAWKASQQKLLLRQSILGAVLLAAAVLFYVLGHSLGAGFAMLGALMLGAALVLPIVLGALLRLGEQAAGRYLSQRPLAKWFWADANQQLSGLALALMALLLAVSVNVGVGTMVGSFRATFLSWLDGRLSADVYLDPESEDKTKAVVAWLRQQPQPIAVLPGARTETTLKDQRVELFGLADDPDYQRQWPLLSSTPQAWSNITQGDAAFVSEQLLRRLNLKLNDTVQVASELGDWPLRIVGVYADYGNPRGQLAVDFQALVKHFPQMPHTRIALRIAPDQRDGIIAALKSRFQLEDRQIADQSAVKAESRRIFERTFAVTAALNLFTLGVAAIALLTSLLTLGNTRLGHWAPLWTMGLALPALARAEILKMLMLALFTVVFAIPLGLAVGWCLLAVVNVRAFGWRLPFHVFPLDMVKLLGIAMLAAFIAAIIPVLRLLRTAPAQLAKSFANER